MADYPRITGTIRPTPRNRVSGFLADLLEMGAKGYDVGSTLQAGGPITEGRLSTPVSDLLGIPELQRTFNRVSYNEPLTTGTGYTTKLRPDTLSAAMTVAPMAGPTAKAGAAGARMAGTALKDLATSDVAYNAMMNQMRRAGGMMEMLPQEDVLMLAQRRAALPVEKGGLGLPANNTPEQRARAMGWDTDAYHGSNKDFKKFRSDQPVFAAVNPAISEGYGNIIYPLVLRGKELTISDLGKGGTSGWFANNLARQLKIPKRELQDLKMPDTSLDDSLLGRVRSFVNRNIGDNVRFSDKGEREMVNRLPEYGIDRLKVTDMSDMGGVQTQYMIPAESDNIRSRFAAFDPFRRSAAVASAMGVAAPDLMAKEKTDKKKKK